MLQTNQIDVVEIQEVRCLPVGRQLIFGKLESDSCGVTIAFFCVIDWQRQKFRRAIFSVDRIAQVCRECRDPALPRKIIPDDGDSTWKRRSRLCGRECWCLLLNSEWAKIDTGHGFNWGHCLWHRHSLAISLPRRPTPESEKAIRGSCVI